MPKRSEPPSLKKLSMHAVLRHLKIYCCDETGMSCNEPDSDSATDDEDVGIAKEISPDLLLAPIDSPFEFIPESLKEDLVEFLRVNRSLCEHSLQLILFTYSGKSISLSGASGNISSYIKDTIGAKFLNLLTLDISNCDLQLDAILHLPEKIPNIVSLNLNQNKSCSDEFLPLLVKHCPKLKLLFLMESAITDEGLTVFISDSPRQLTHLDLRETQTTHVGLYHALVNLPKLVCLKHADILSAFVKMAEMKRDMLRGRRFKITRLTGKSSSWKSCDAETASLIVEACPNVERLTVTEDLPAQVLVGLSRFLNLSSVRIHAPLDISSLRKLLVLVGPQLSDLVLVGSGSHLKSAAWFCPNAKSLTFFMFLYKEDEEMPWPVDAFAQLTKLSVVSFEGDQNFDLVPTLSSCLKLESLDLCGVDTVTDDAMDTILDSNPMSFLTNVSFQGCDNLTIKGIERIYKQTINLRKIECIACENVHQDDFVEFIKCADDQNFDCNLMYARKEDLLQSDSE